ncbi:hypothetical protein BAS06_15510 [Elizabethkingia miricola]|uniref:Uncharacterized protein n=1 Tax=Elizabethkingia miricola TaxID=172045 RepID=A0ABD5B405_ELIMR|nr:hypothetical protein [Elizabethkingia miricola]MDQ8748062.1 hypothetical protein [Elizabethkingia miricola]OPB86609.1 hypothetical protein BAS06_15510 [Elizabethkingia miricola]
MKNYLIFFVLLSSFAFGQKAPQDLSDFQKIFDRQLKTWKASIPGFSVQNFKAHNNFGFDNIPQEDQSVREFTSFVKNYKNLLMFSPDKKHFIDLYSSSLYYDVKKKKYIAAYDIDSQVDLGDMQNHKSSRIYFMGSSAWIEDAAWIDNDRFILAGIHSDEQSQRIPYIIIGSIKDKSLQAYHCTGNACIQTIGYKAANIGKIKIEDD